jgi:hypothetical protein
VLADIAAQPIDQNKLNQLIAQHRPALQKFQKMYQHWWQVKGPGPFAGCVACRAKCLYRHEVYPLTRDQALERNFTKAIQEPAAMRAMWEKLAQVTLDAARRVVPKELEKAVGETAVCYAAQMGVALEFSRDSQVKLTQNVARSLFK